MQKIKVLLSEGSSLSARQTITALGFAGYDIDICVADTLCIGRFSKYVNKRYVLPVSGDDPVGYMKGVLEILKDERYDVLLPTHEQAFLFAKEQRAIRQYTHLALASFDAFGQVQGKTACARLFDKLHIPQPAYAVISNPEQFKPAAWDNFPAYAKLAYGTAGQGVWHVRTAKELRGLVATLAWEKPNELLVQAETRGALCQAQALFSHGTLVALHCTQQLAVGIGNSQSARRSVDHPNVRIHLKKLGEEVSWHGPIALDYLYDETIGPQYIEANPRLVEPMNATYSGTNLAALTAELSLKGNLPIQPQSKSNVASHSLLATALGVADRTGSRVSILASIAKALFHVGRFERSREDLTPASDIESLIPLIAVLLQLLVAPLRARSLATKNIGQYSLSAKAIKQILTM